MKSRIIILLLVVICKMSSAQNNRWLPIFFTDYNYSHQHILRGGLEFMLVNNTKSDSKLFLGAGYGMTIKNRHSRGLADLHLSYNDGNLLFAKVGLSEYHTYYLIGISGLNVFDLGIGYSLPHKNVSVIKQGFTVGLTFRITAREDVYRKLKFGF